MKQFQKVPIAVNQRSTQNLSSNFIGSHDFGRLDVVYHNADIVPGDNINLKIDGFLRGAPMPAPTFGEVDIDVRVFFVPHRIATSRPSEGGSFSWDNYITGVSAATHPCLSWRKIAQAFIPDSGDDAPYSSLDVSLRRDCRRLLSQLKFPQELYNASSVQDYMGEYFDNGWLLHAYQRVWWDWYRDSNLIDESLIRNYCPLLIAGLQNDSVTETLCTPRYSCFRKDYFTTARLNPQSGSATSASALYYTSGGDVVGHESDNTPLIGTGMVDAEQQVLPIQWLRAANALQTYLERNNLSGSRLMERFLARFGVSPSTVALDMSEYLGGARRTLRIGDVTANTEQFGSSFTPTNAFNTAGVDGSASGTILGQLGGKSASDISSGSINFHAKEFGTIIAIQTIVPHVSYVQGLPKEHQRGLIHGKEDYFTPEFENIGFEPIMSTEIFGEADVINQIFGYAPRYQSYKTRQDVVAGDLVLTGTSAGMDSWHLARIFDTAPQLTYDFTMITPAARHSLDRIFSVIGEIGQFDHFNSTIHTECHIERNMSDNALPSLEESRGGNAIEIQNGGVRF